MAGLIDFTNPMVDAAHARYTQLKQSGMPDEQIFQVMDQEKTLVPLGQLAAKVMALKNAAQQTPMPPQNTINDQVDQQIQQMQNPQQQGIGALPQNAVTPPQGQMPQSAPAPQQMPQGMPQQAQAPAPQQPAPQQMPQGMPQQAQAPAPQGMAEGGLATLPVDNVGDEKAYAAGGIVAFAKGDLVEDDSNDDDYSGFTFSTGPNTTAPASQFILGNQPLGASPAPTQRKQTTPGLTSPAPTPPGTPAASPTDYWSLATKELERRQKEADVKVKSVDEILADFEKTKKDHGIASATTALNSELDKMENEIAERSKYNEKIADMKKWTAMGEQASKTGQGGSQLNKFLASMIAGQKEYANTLAANEKEIQAQKDKLFEHRLAITKAAREENLDDLRAAMLQHKGDVATHVAAVKEASDLALGIAKEREDKEFREKQIRTNAELYADPTKERLRKYYAAKDRGDEKLAQEYLNTMREGRAAYTDPTGTIGDKYNYQVLLQELKAAQTEVQNASLGLGDLATAQQHLREVQDKINSLSSGGSSGSGTPSLSGTSGGTFLGFEPAAQ